jgi:hypothetical protein
VRPAVDGPRVGSNPLGIGGRPVPLVWHPRLGRSHSVHP